MSDEKREKDLPLHEEAEARGRWRDDARPGEAPRPAEPGEGSRDPSEDGRPGGGGPGTFPPPD